MKNLGENIKKFFKSFNIFEMIYLPLALAGTIALSIIGKSDALNIIYALLFIIACFCNAKGVFFAPILLVIDFILYAIISYSNALYGEFIIELIIIPINILAFVLWIKNRKKGSTDVKVSKIGYKEWICIFVAMIAIGVGVFFLLKYLKNNYLVLSTFSFAIGLIANYLTFRRSPFQFVIYIIQNLFLITIWILPYAQGIASGTELWPIAFSFVCSLISNIYGIINWIKLSKSQKTENEQKMENEQKNENEQELEN